MPAPFATLEDLAEELTGTRDGETPENALPLLRRAEQLVRGAVSARFRVGPDGLPTDAGKREALRLATLEQAAAWVRAGIDPREGAQQLTPQVASKSALGVSVSYATPAAATAEREQLARGTELLDTARHQLQLAGLTSNRASTPGYGRDVYVDARAYDPTTGRLVEG